MNTVTLLAARKAAGLTQEQLEERSGVDQTTISRLEREADSNPTPDTVKRLAKALRIAPSKLRFEEPQPDGTVDPSGDSAGHTPSDHSPASSSSDAPDEAIDRRSLAPTR
jgi:transcriptional regulator with XRE-family HTH domain